MSEHPALRPDGTVDVDYIRELVRTGDPEYVARSRDDLIGLAELFRAMRDAERLREALRAARIAEWEMAHRWPVKGMTGRRGDDRPALTPADGKANTDAWQKVYAVGRTPLEWIATAPLIEDVSQRAFRSKDAHVGANSGVPEWYTPADLIEAARDVLGEIDLDPASSDIANKTVRAERYFTVDDNGLDEPWTGRVWMNPPYTAGLVDQFVVKLLNERAGGNVTAALVLTNNSTDTRWWQSMGRCATAVCHLAGRVKFLDPDGEPGAPLQGQTICYLGDNTSAFVERFDEFGVVL